MITQSSDNDPWNRNRHLLIAMLKGQLQDVVRIRAVLMYFNDRLPYWVENHMAAADSALDTAERQIKEAIHAAENPVAE